MGSSTVFFAKSALTTTAVTTLVRVAVVMVYLTLFGVDKLLLGPAKMGAGLLLGAGLCAALIYQRMARIHEGA